MVIAHKKENQNTFLSSYTATKERKMVKPCIYFPSKLLNFNFSCSKEIWNRSGALIYLFCFLCLHVCFLALVSFTVFPVAVLRQLPSLLQMNYSGALVGFYFCFTAQSSTELVRRAKNTSYSGPLFIPATGWGIQDGAECLQTSLWPASELQQQSSKWWLW